MLLQPQSMIEHWLYGKNMDVIDYEISDIYIVIYIINLFIKL